MYDLGDTVRLTADCRDAAGTLTNATTVALTITLPDGTTTAPSVTNPPAQTGKYLVDYVTTQSGRHTARWLFTTPTAAFTDAFDVAPATTGEIIGLAEAKEHLKISANDTTYDERLRGLIASVTGVVEDIVGPVVRRTVTEVHGGGRTTIWLNEPPVISIASVTESGVAVPASGYSLNSGGRLRRVSGYTPLTWQWGIDNITVVDVVGRTVVADCILEGSRELIRINFRPHLGGNYSPYDGGRADDFGTPERGEWRLGFFVPNRVMQQLQPEAKRPEFGR